MNALARSIDAAAVDAPDTLDLVAGHVVANAEALRDARVNPALAKRVAGKLAGAIGALPTGRASLPTLLLCVATIQWVEALADQGLCGVTTDPLWGETVASLVKLVRGASLADHAAAREAGR